MNRIVLAALALSMFPALAHAGAPKATDAQKAAAKFVRAQPSAKGMAFRAPQIQTRFLNGANFGFSVTAYKANKGLAPTVENISGTAKTVNNKMVFSNFDVTPAKFQPLATMK